MKLRGHGNAIAIALAGLAFVLAATGTAYAVTTTTVNIADPTTPSRVAHVDSSGRLTTVGVSSTLDSDQYVSVGATTLTEPTTASIAVSRVGYFNTAQNSNYSNTDWNVALVKIDVGSSGTCYDSNASIETYYSHAALPIGSSPADEYPAPLIIKATGTTKYCIGAVVHSEDSGTDPGTYYLPLVQLTGYVYSGTYTGVGISATPASLPAATPLATPAHPHPERLGH